LCSYYLLGSYNEVDTTSRTVASLPVILYVQELEFYV
jgi:hypothetical protein